MINKLDVYINFSSKIKVWILVQKDKKIYFEYDKKFLKLGPIIVLVKVSLMKYIL